MDDKQLMLEIDQAKVFSGEVCISLATTQHLIQDLVGCVKTCAEQDCDKVLSKEAEKWEIK